MREKSGVEWLGGGIELLRCCSQMGRQRYRACVVLATDPGKSMALENLGAILGQKKIAYGLSTICDVPMRPFP